MASSTTITINSKHVAESIDSQIILLVKTLQIEQAASLEDALETTRVYVNKKSQELMNEDDKNNIIEIAANIKAKFKKSPNDISIREIYRILNYFGIFDIK